jgi:hypothetical protein
MKLELKHIAPYLPYGLNVVFDNKISGILSGIRPNLLTELIVMEELDNNTPIYKNWCLDDTKPVLKPLSDISNEIEVNGKKITPIIELAKINGFHYKFGEIVNENDTIVLYSKPVKHPTANSPLVKHFFEMDLDNCDFDWGFVFFDKDDKKEVETVFFPIRNQMELFNKLLEWNFDVLNLIPQGLAISYNELKEK